MTFEEWKKKSKTGLSRDTLDILNFERCYPQTVKEYRERKAAEEKKRSEIMEIKDTKQRLKAISENMRIFGY